MDRKMDYQAMLDRNRQERDQLLIRMGYLEGQSDLLRALLEEQARPPDPEKPDANPSP